MFYKIIKAVNDNHEFVNFLITIKMIILFIYNKWSSFEVERKIIDINIQKKKSL